MYTHTDTYEIQEVEQRNTNHKKEVNRNSSKKNSDNLKIQQREFQRQTQTEKKNQ